MMAVLQVHLLGRFEVIYAGEPLLAINTPRLQSLFAYLILNQSAPISRQQLAYQFWPDTSDAHARANLRHLFHLLRKALPNADNFLQSNNQTISWLPDASVELDAAEFERAASQFDRLSELERAERL